MKAIVYEGPGRIAVREMPAPEVTEGVTLIQVSHAGICGSDMTIRAGKHPRAKAPLVLGHEFSGRIVSPHPTLPPGALVTVYPHIACGRCAICEEGLAHTCSTLKIIGIDGDGGMSEYAAVPNDAVYPVAEGVSPALAAFVEPISVGVHAARHGGYVPGHSAVVFGGGGIGLSLALTLRHFGADRLLLCEPNEGRRALARSLGFAVARGADTLRDVMEFTHGKGAAFVFDCAGHQSVIDILPDAVKIGGVIVMVAGYKTPPAMNFQKGMLREFSLRFVRNSAKKDFAVACGLAASVPGYEQLLNCVLPLSRAQEGFDTPPGALKVLFDIGKRECGNEG